VGGSSRLLEPLVEALRRHVMSGSKLHADDTPVPVLAPGQGKTKTGRLWTYVRDDRPAGDGTPAAVWFACSPDRKGEHPQAHLSQFTGTLQADGYAGFDQIYQQGRIQEAACWAHARRKFYDLQVAHKSLVAAEALERIGALYAIEKEIHGRSPEERREIRNARSRQLLESLKQWLEETLGKLSRKSDTAVARAFTACAATPPSADFCHRVRNDFSPLSLEFETGSRSPEVSSTAFDAQPLDLHSVSLMD
jgi:transposase